METTYLKTLVVAARTGSFSKTALELNITQSAVSQRIKFLEERFGNQLFDRSGAVLVPTDAGNIVIRKAESILLLEHELQDELKRMHGKSRFSHSCTPTFGIVYLPRVLNDFMLKNADVVDLKFIFSTPELALKGLQENEFDVSVIEHCDDMDLSEFLTVGLTKDELVFVSSPSLDLPTPVVTFDRLLQERLIARKEGCSSRKLLNLNLTMLGRSLAEFDRMVIYDDLRLTIQTVLAGGGIAFVSRSLVQDHLDAGRLMEHRVDGFCHHRQRTVAVNRKKKDEPIIKDFLDSLFNSFHESEATPPATFSLTSTAAGLAMIIPFIG
jgi:DNA-binding transcriptional LysR family regulator